MNGTILSVEVVHERTWKYMIRYQKQDMQAGIERVTAMDASFPEDKPADVLLIGILRILHAYGLPGPFVIDYDPITNTAAWFKPVRFIQEMA